ncbi:precorrin-3B C(17)-methyltransferase [Candidatus Thiosymbion oneisti]|uniref:precorrin-3B C(17)-methyltransferase n=1 Tax=Candidatus Thiosymbion oneisti TaxID=589554 RepID=UPI000A96D40C|nr:precorrin-3B C(17)-methyltransferase [Candidatus Thiosymbion oneisti]
MNRGKLFVVGLGPGASEQMSLRARQAIAESEVVIGYAKYVDLVKDLLAGKEVVRKGMTQEVDRCIAAYERASRGRTVALVSSGDSGVYGMAGLTYEVLLRSGWTPDAGIEVEVVPGITALSACASLVGAPLSHDFCAISLSDLLTPWPLIARRLEAAAKGDFVVALYNPRSGRRQQQLVAARDILLRHRRPDTPVAIVNAAYRDQQTTHLSRLDMLPDCQIGMLSTVLVGNGDTYRRGDLMITPRGYSHKYDDLTGHLKPGERSGRSLSMGLEGWRSCVRAYLRAAEGPSLEDTARYFDAPPGEILAAVGEATDADRAGAYAAAAVRHGKEAILLDAARGWGRVRIFMRSGTGAESELLLNADGLIRHGDSLFAQASNFRLYIDWSRVRRGWLVRRGERSRGLYCVDAAGNSLFALFLVHDQGRFDQEAVARYERAWQDALNDRSQWTRRLLTED